MARYHLNPVTGSPGKCEASTGPCPFGGDEAHFASAEEAMAQYERLMASMTLPEPTRQEAARQSAISAMMNDAITDPTVRYTHLSSSGDVFSGTVQDLAVTLGPGLYRAYTEDGVEAELTLDDEGGIAFRIPDPALEAARILDEASLLAAAHEASELTLPSPISEDWLTDRDEYEASTAELVIQARRASERATTQREEARVRMSVISPSSIEYIEAADELDACEQVCRSTEASLEKAVTNFTAQAERRRADLRFASTLARDLADQLRVEHVNVEAEIVRQCSTELAALTESEAWATPHTLVQVAEDLRALSERIELVAYNSEPGQGQDCLFTVQGSLEPVLDGFADLLPPQ